MYKYKSMQVSLETRRGPCIALELELQVAMIYLVWVLGTKLGSSASSSALNC